MIRTSRRARVIGALVVVLAAGVGVNRLLAPPAVAMSIPTYAATHANVCPAYAVVRPLTGVLRVNRQAADPLWLEHDGRRLYLVWPQGFHLVFAPTASLVDESGRTIANEGQTLTLTQTNTYDHAGTTADPYVAQGMGLGFGCYYPRAAG